MKTSDVTKGWRAEFGDDWKRAGVFPSVEGYVYVVVEQRLGERKSLSYDKMTAPLHLNERSVRTQIRAQVDVVIKRLQEEQS